MCKRRIGVLFGGRSEEHDVSLVSACSVIRALNPDKFVPIYIGITKEGKWKKYDGAAEKIMDGSWEKHARSFNPGDLIEAVDFALPVLHGPYGEDGCIQGFLETLGIPYGGCGVLASAVAMDKQLFKQLMKENGFPVCAYTCLTREEILKDAEVAAKKVIESIGLPCFVKPTNMGSSVGISKAGSKKELYEGLKTACLYDNKVIIEEYIKARELEIAALGGSIPEFTDIGEITPSKEFYDYQAKYSKSGAPSKLTIPAVIEESERETVRKLAAGAYKAVGGYGFCRIDFFMEENTHNIYINEINTIPGFTDGSMFPLLWQNRGLEYGEIIERIIDLGYERYYAENNRQTTV